MDSMTKSVPPEPKEITHVSGPDGEMVPLTEWLCANCGKPGCTHIAMHEDGSWAFCSWDHLMEAMRIDGAPLTEASMRAAGLHVIGPRPDA